MDTISTQLENSKQKINVLADTLIKVYPNYKLLNTNETQSQYNNTLKQIDKEMKHLVGSKQSIKDIHKDLNKKIQDINIGLEFSKGLYSELQKKYEETIQQNEAYEPRETYFEYLRNQQIVGIVSNTIFVSYLGYMIYLLFTKKV